jgi:type I restriction enzyme S subunit
MRMAERLDALLAKVSGTRERLTRAREALKRFRQSVLSAACSGRLTEEWRAHHAPEALSADAVLTARRRAWVRAATSRRANEGRPISEADLLKRYVAPAEPDAPGDAPDSWLWTTLDQITLLSGGLTKGQKRGAHVKVRPVPYLRVANVQRGHIDLSVIKEIEATEAEIAELQLQSGDILLNEGGDIDKLGRGWVWEGQIAACIHQNHVFRARPVAESINPYFVSYYANALGQDFFFSAGAQTVNLASVSLSKVRTLPVPLPPSAEQAEIVRRVETLFALADTIEGGLRAAVVRIESLSHAILAKAFRGELVAPEAQAARAP